MSKTRATDWRAGFSTIDFSAGKVIPHTLQKKHPTNEEVNRESPKCVWGEAKKMKMTWQQKNSTNYRQKNWRIPK